MIHETYALRKQRESRGGEPDVYIYDIASEQLRHQIRMTLSEGIGNFFVRDTFNRGPTPPNSNDVWIKLDRICHKEIFNYLNYMDNKNVSQRFLSFVQTASHMDDFLSGVELGCLSLYDVRTQSKEQRRASLTGDAAIAEINSRFQQHGVGYQFENGQIIRIDSKLVHAEVIKPALSLLMASEFAKANEDFMTAHRHYRTGEFKDCIVAANRAYESMLKAICGLEDWVYVRGDGAAQLVTIVKTKGLFTHDFDKSITAYVAMLKAGLPAVRNDAGGHGDGIAAAAVTAHIAQFALNLTASNVLFLGESYATMKQSR